MLIIKVLVNESDAKSYFKLPLRDVYESFYHDSYLFDEEGTPFRSDYYYLRRLFKRWNMKPICDSLFAKDREN